MAKKRKTRQEKIILQLKRELAKKSQVPASKNTEPEPSQEAISQPKKIKVEKKLSLKKTDISILSSEPSLIRHDLVKTLILSLAVISLEFVLYLALR
ncbi:hypothetical protein A2Z41_01995 [Microgenomates group bacterium RBG_19FT_COMBO_39_10]|nr:MAG: hypothetical protein A2Z41_01995 [Microgenomates group bacterium RBG_19FT_COMBO_39_10]